MKKASFGGKIRNYDNKMKTQGNCCCCVIGFENVVISFSRYQGLLSTENKI